MGNLRTLLSALLATGEAFLRPPHSTPPVASAVARGKGSRSRLHGIQEWRDHAADNKYTLDAYREWEQSNSPPPLSSVPAAIPILPFPFSDVLLQGQRTQLNLYEQRFHELFQDAMDNHCGVVGMGLLAGNGMITTLPLCEVESFARIGADEDWSRGGGGMGNGSIFATIRAVGRARIVESNLMQEEPYMKAQVAEVLDDGISIEGGGVKGKNAAKLSGESSPLSVATSIAANIENLLLSLASMEHKLVQIEEGREMLNNERGQNDAKDEVMNRRIVNAQLESLFMKADGSSEGIDIESSTTDWTDEDVDEDDHEDDTEDDTYDGTDRVSQFRHAFEDAKEADTSGYVVEPTIESDSIPRNAPKQPTRTARDLTAISWAAFCTGEKNSIQRDVMKIQALDMTNVMQRLQLASAMLREEKKKLEAKLALAAMKDKREE